MRFGIEAATWDAAGGVVAYYDAYIVKTVANNVALSNSSVNKGPKPNYSYIQDSIIQLDYKTTIAVPHLRRVC